MYSYEEWYDYKEAKSILKECENKKWTFNESVRFSVVRPIWKDSHSPWTSDKVMRLLNYTEEYKSDPLYILAWELVEKREEWPEWSNLYNFYKTIQVKIENRCLSEYNELYNEETNTINSEVVNRFVDLEKKYWKIWFEHLSIWDYLGHYPNSKNSIISAHFIPGVVTISDWEKTIIESLDFLEKKYEELEVMHNQWIKNIYIWLYLSNPNFITIINWLKKLWKVWEEAHYSYINKEHCLWVNDSWNTLVRWDTLEEMIQNYNENWFRDLRKAS